MSGRTPEADFRIEEDLVADLLDEQFPELARLRLRHVASGWDNELYRLGDDLAVRLPRRAVASELVEHEQRWLAELAPRLPLRVPVPLRHGRPGRGYPWSWSVVPWFAGNAAAVEPPTRPEESARRLGMFLSRLHRAAPPSAPRNPVRGIPLSGRDDGARAAIAALDGRIDAAAVTAAWRSALVVREWDRPAVWVHGDLHPGNVIVEGGHVVAVVDFGDLTAGDPATDYAIAWTMFGAGARSVLRRVSGVDDATWERGRGWAIALALAVLQSSDDNPPYAAFAERALRRAIRG